jgi:hypothetical protein
LYSKMKGAVDEDEFVETMCKEEKTKMRKS